MTATPSPKHLARLQDAQTMGRRAGWNHRMLQADMTRDRAEWCALLREIRVNPWAPGEYTNTDVTAAEAGQLAKQWDRSFDVGTHAAEAQLGRTNTTRRAA